MQTSNAAPKCSYCGGFPHQGVCPSVKAIEYHADGVTVKRVEFKSASDYPPVTGPYSLGGARTTLRPAIVQDPFAGRGYYEEDAPGYDEAS